MAVRYRKDRKKWQTYWVDPKTGKRTSRMFDTKLEAEKLDDTIKFKKKYEPESFLAEEEEETIEEENSLENILFAYLREKRFEKKGVRWIMGCMEIPLKVLGSKKLEDITGSTVFVIMSFVGAMLTFFLMVSTIYTLATLSSNEGINAVIVPKEADAKRPAAKTEASGGSENK